MKTTGKIEYRIGLLEQRSGLGGDVLFAIEHPDGTYRIPSVRKIVSRDELTEMGKKFNTVFIWDIPGDLQQYVHDLREQRVPA